MNPLMQNLRKKDKKGIFNKTQTMPSYSTGFTNLDYYNGYYLDSFDEDDKIVETTQMVGLVGGSFVTIIGKSGVAKSTAAIQISTNIVKPFDSGLVQHFDLEQATNYTRVKNVTQLSIRELENKYILKQEKSTIEEIFESCEAIWREKTQDNRKEYEYDTGIKNEFNEPIVAIVPTVVIVDSIPTITTNDVSDGMEGGTYANRIAKAIAQFYKRMTPIIKEANIILIAINHINQKIEINPRLKTQPQLLYMKMDESLPGGQWLPLGESLGKQIF